MNFGKMYMIWCLPQTEKSLLYSLISAALKSLMTFTGRNLVMRFSCSWRKSWKNCAMTGSFSWIRAVTYLWSLQSMTMSRCWWILSKQLRVDWLCLKMSSCNLRLACILSRIRIWRFVRWRIGLQSQGRRQRRMYSPMSFFIRSSSRNFYIHASS